MRKICNNCGFQQDKFLSLGGRRYCVNCNSEIKNVSSSQMSVQREKTAHQLKLALGNLRFTLEALEKYFERAYGNNYPGFKSQLYERKAEDDNYPLENSREQFLTQLLIMKGVCKGEPEFFRNEIKKEFNKWISVVGIDVNNCPDEIKNFLFEVNEVLEDRGEKIIKENEARIKNVKFEPKGVIGLFSALQEPMNRAREERENYEGKNWNELGNENRFDVSDEQGEKGQEAFNKIFQEIAPKQGDFNFYQQDPQQRSNSEIIQDVKNNLQNWRIDEIITEYDNLGRATKREKALIHNSAQIGYDGSVLGNNQPVYLANRFNQAELAEINQALNISQTSGSTQKYQQNQSDKSISTSSKIPNSNNNSLRTVAIITGILALASLGIYGIIRKSKKVRK